MFRTGDLVEVRSREEILAMLDADGHVPGDRLPFMPEMLQYCGRRFRVSNVAHKTCDTATFLMGRRMRDTVFLEDLRCDGSAHDGCQARCLLFWRTQWLRPISEASNGSPKVMSADAAPAATRKQSCTECQLHNATRAVRPDGDVRFFCQATEHWAASEPLRPLAPWHYIQDVRTGNATVGEVLKVLMLQFVWRLRFFKRGWRASVWLYDRLHRRFFGRPDPYREGRIREGSPTPEERLDLAPGDLVEVKSHEEILCTVTTELRNRGMRYNAEMTPACGRQFRVAQRVSQIIEERSGRMITMKNPCIMLEGVYCQALYTPYSPLCSRRAPPFFREVWLRRVADHAGNGQST